jgi:hypothetical protein
MRPGALRAVVAGATLLTGGVGGTVAACGAASPSSASAGDASSASETGTDAESTGAGDADAGGGASDAPGPPIFPDAGADCGFGTSGEPLDLSCTGLYSDWPSKAVAAGVEPFAPAYVLWSDGANGQRWIALPPGTQIDTSDMDEWKFPADTRIWQEMRLPLGLGDASSATRIETRLLWKQPVGSWVRTTYRWSADGETSAVELLSGEQNVAGTTYEIPAWFVCDGCHAGRRDGVLGFEAVSLSAPGASGLTMQALEARGLLGAPPASPPVVPGNATESAALGWLHANCGTSCHNGGRGNAGSSGLLLRLDVATLASVQTTDAYVTGWNQLTKGFSISDAAPTYRIHACDLAESASYYRASVRDGVNGVSFSQMPNVLTHVPDDAGLAQLAAWIDEGCDGGP